MKQDIAFSNAPSASSAAQELCSQLPRSLTSYGAVIFFASSKYDFAELSGLLRKAFPNAEVIGATTSGEISQKGFTSNSVILNALYDADGRSRFKGVLIDNANQFPAVHRNDIIQAASSVGIQLSSPEIHRDSFAISLICGLKNAEEGTLSLLYALINDPDFLVCGGTAGDDLAFKATFVSCNGICSDCAAVILFVKTQSPFVIYKENIFKKSGKTVRLTDVQHETYLVKRIDNQSPRQRYAEVLGISESAVNDAILDHPFGRSFGDSVFIASLVQFHQDGSLNTYARVIQDSIQEILEPMDTLAITEETCKSILEKIPRPSCVILFNCILRTLGFDKKHQKEAVASIWSRYFPHFSGFSTYGEQFGHVNSNQTLVALVIGD